MHCHWLGQVFERMSRSVCRSRCKIPAASWQTKSNVLDMGQPDITNLQFNLHSAWKSMLPSPSASMSSSSNPRAAALSHNGKQLYERSKTTRTTEGTCWNTPAGTQRARILQICLLLCCYTSDNCQSLGMMNVSEGRARTFNSEMRGSISLAVKAPALGRGHWNVMKIKAGNLLNKEEKPPRTSKQ